MACLPIRLVSIRNRFKMNEHIVYMNIDCVIMERRSSDGLSFRISASG